MHERYKLTEKQMKLIELLVEGNLTIKDACEQVGISRVTYYSWMQGEGKKGRAFQKAYEEALDFKVNESKRRIKNDINGLIDSLMKIIKSGSNETAKVNAVAKLLTYAELDPQFKQEVTIKTDDSESKNALLDMLEKKKESNQD